ncbi:MAG: hypothetical protein WC861_05905 [Candidatus Micrarchaeia archaeon]|jgi:hypothetical protein
MPQANELPFSARYSLPVQVSKLIKELQMSRLILMERISRGTREGRIDPRLLVDVVRLLQRCEDAMEEHDIDLKEFSTYLYLVSEKLKKEKMARHEGAGMSGIAPMRESHLGAGRGNTQAAKKGGRKK